MNLGATSEPARITPWRWIAVAAAAALGSIEIRRLATLIRWQRTLSFAHNLLPGAIAAAIMTAAAYLLILVLLLVRRGRKWGLALGIGWGAIVAGSSLWLWLGARAKNLWYETAFRLHVTNTLRHYISMTGPAMREAQLVAGLGALLALSAAKTFADSPRERLDRGILLASFFCAAFYGLATVIVAGLVTPH
ncbi:MAG: hypothetical protein WBQ34_16145 [Candidatus Acidiferrales bacterium]